MSMKMNVFNSIRPPRRQPNFSPPTDLNKIKEKHHNTKPSIGHYSLKHDMVARVNYPSAGCKTCGMK